MSSELGPRCAGSGVKARCAWSRAALFLSILVVALAASCRREAPGEEYATRIARELSRRTAPDGASVSCWSEAKGDGWKIQLSWALRTDGDCGAYFAWVEERLGGDFEKVDSRENERTFVRAVHGDRHVLELHAIENASCSLKLRVSTAPD